MYWLLAALVVFTSSCKTSSEKTVDNLEKLFTRESTEVEGKIYKESFFNKELILHIKSQSPVTPIESKELQGISFSVGSKTNIHCYVQTLSLPGTNISSIINKVQSSENIETIVEPFTEVAVYKSRPVIYLASFYQTNDQLLGDFKLAHIMLDNHSINCTHDEPGYRKTFRSVIKYLAENSEESVLSHKIIEKNVYIVKLGKLPAGFVVDLEAKNKSERFRVNYQSMAIPVSKTSIKTYDSQSINFLDQDRLVTRNISIAFENEEASYQLGYDRLDSKKYQIQGVYDDKSINRVVSTAKDIVLEEDAIKFSVRQKKLDFDLVVYQPYVAPRDFVTGKVVIDKNLQQGAFTTPDSSMTFFLDKNQNIEKQILHGKGYDLRIERVYQKPVEIQTAVLKAPS